MGKYRKGFTLIELLVVVVVVGVVASAMMISGTEMSESARASAIINDLEVLKNAATTWYLDHIEEVSQSNSVLSKVTKADLLPYVKYTDENDPIFDFKPLYENEVWYIMYNLNNTPGWTNGHKDEGIKRRLARHAQELGLYEAGGHVKKVLYGTTDDNKNQEWIAIIVIGENTGA